MALGQGPVASAVVRGADLPLDPAEVSGLGDGRRGLVGAQRRAVLAEQCMYVSDRLLQRGGGGMTKLQSRAKMTEGLDVSVEAARLRAGEHEVLGRLGVFARHLIVSSDSRGGRFAPSTGLRVRGERVSDAAVQEPAPCDADVLGNEAPELVVGKVVERRVTPVHLFDEAGARQLLHRRDRLVLVTATGLVNGVEPEPAPDHRGGVQKLPSRFAQGRDAREQKAAHSHRHLPTEPLVL